MLKWPGSERNELHLSNATGVKGGPMYESLPHEKTGRYLVIKCALFPLKYFSSDSLPLGEE